MLKAFWFQILNFLPVFFSPPVLFSPFLLLLSQLHAEEQEPFLFLPSPWGKQKDIVKMKDTKERKVFAVLSTRASFNLKHLHRAKWLIRPFTYHVALTALISYLSAAACRSLSSSLSRSRSCSLFSSSALRASASLRARSSSSAFFFASCCRFSSSLCFNQHIQHEKQCDENFSLSNHESVDQMKLSYTNRHD